MSKPIKLSACETIVDEERFMEMHKAIAKNPHHTFDPYRERLNKYYELKKQTNGAKTNR